MNAASSSEWVDGFPVASQLPLEIANIILVENPTHLDEDAYMSYVGLD